MWETSLSRHYQLSLSRPPADTDSNQGWRWSVDRGTHGNAIRWGGTSGMAEAGRQAREDAWIRQGRTGEATWIVLRSWKPIPLERMEGSPASADNPRRIRRTPHNRRTARDRVGKAERCKANDPALRQRRQRIERRKEKSSSARQDPAAEKFSQDSRV